MEWKVRVHHEEGSYWAEVIDLPGCLASGDSMDELLEALREAIALCVEDDVSSASAAEIEVAEMTMASGGVEPQAA
jgi:predicted RNase H-like HicB family nuclease